ncbi:MAG: hypothetical protein ABIH23_16750, partial [bacterium]
MRLQRVAALLLCILSASIPVCANGGKAVTVPQPDPVLEAWRWQFFTEADGLASVRVNGVAQAGGAVWFATDRGVCRFEGKDWRSYQRETGLEMAPVASVYAASDGEGTLWFGTDRGALCYDGGGWTHRPARCQIDIYDVFGRRVWRTFKD